MRDTQSQTRTRAMLVTALGTEIVAALDDPAVVEIMINPDGRLWIERHGSGRTESGLIVTAGNVERVIRLVASHMGRRAHRVGRIADGRGTVRRCLAACSGGTMFLHPQTCRAGDFFG